MIMYRDTNNTGTIINNEPSEFRIAIVNRNNVKYLQPTVLLVVIPGIYVTFTNATRYHSRFAY